MLLGEGTFGEGSDARDNLEAKDTGDASLAAASMVLDLSDPEELDVEIKDE